MRMRLREVLVATLIAGCGSVSDNSPDAPTVGPDTTPPMIIGSHPDKMSMKVSVVMPVSVLFDEALDPATVSATTVTARYAVKLEFFDLVSTFRYENVGRVPASSVTYDPATKKIVFNPLLPLPYNARVDVTLDGVKDVAGNPLAATHLVFDTLANYERYQTRYVVGGEFSGQIITYADFGTASSKQVNYTAA